MVNLPRSAFLLDRVVTPTAHDQPQPSAATPIVRKVEPSRVEALKARFIQCWCLGQAEPRFQSLVAGVIRIPGSLPREMYVSKSADGRIRRKSQCLP